ncbi:MAG: hypothetical protein GX660_05330 [Clostridiaceae bacterium]|nr:hypothetical protein [Clostridiaceae bacterium]
MSKQIHIFATKSDLIPGIKLVESQREIRYVLYEDFSSSCVPYIDSLLNYEKLGINHTGSHTTGDMFFVLDKKNTLNVEKASGFFGLAKYSFNQLNNPDSIVFQPGGLYKNKHLICGHIGTASDSRESLDLYRQFSKTIIKGFVKVKSYYVGEEAYKMLEGGERLITIGVNSPREYDLELPKAK